MNTKIKTKSQVVANTQPVLQQSKDYSHMRQSKNRDNLREKLLAHVASNESLEKLQKVEDKAKKEASESIYVSAYEHYALRKYEPKGRL